MLKELDSLPPFDKIVYRKVVCVNKKEFSELVGEIPSQVRYLISECIMPAPDGQTSSASYGERHVEAVRRYQFLRSAGYRPSEVKEMLKAEKRITIQVQPGVFLSWESDLMGQLNAENIGTEVTRLLSSLQGKETPCL